MIFRKSLLFTTLMLNVGKQNIFMTDGYIEKVVIFDSVIKRDFFFKFLTSKCTRFLLKCFHEILPKFYKTHINLT